MATLLRDKRGTTVITYALVLPIFFLLIFGAFEVWKIISVKQSLNAGTYQAARCLSVHLHKGRDEARKKCEKLLLTELAKSFITEDYLGGLDLNKCIKYYDTEENRIERQDLASRIHCNEIFSIRAELPLPWPLFIPGLRPRSKNMVLVEWHTSCVECTDYDVPLEIQLPN